MRYTYAKVLRHSPRSEGLEVEHDIRRRFGRIGRGRRMIDILLVENALLAADYEPDLKISIRGRGSEIMIIDAWGLEDGSWIQDCGSGPERGSEEVFVGAGSWP